MGCTEPLKRGVGAPQQCPLESLASCLCHSMLTCGFTFRRLIAMTQVPSCSAYCIYDSTSATAVMQFRKKFGLASSEVFDAQAASMLLAVALDDG